MSHFSEHTVEQTAPCLSVVPEEWEGVSMVMARSILPLHLPGPLQRWELPTIGMLFRAQATAGSSFLYTCTDPGGDTAYQGHSWRLTGRCQGRAHT